MTLSPPVTSWALAEPQNAAQTATSIITSWPGRESIPLLLGRPWPEIAGGAYLLEGPTGCGAATQTGAPRPLVVVAVGSTAFYLSDRTMLVLMKTG